MNLNQKNICINCGVRGHIFKYCDKPIISYGIILYKTRNSINRNIEYLMIERRDSIGFTDLIRGKYDTEETIKEYIQSMTYTELYRINTMSFKDLWDSIFMNKKSRIYKNEYSMAYRKFERLEVENIINSQINSIKYCLAEVGFPKGRKHLDESELSCAKREFFEETGISDEYYTIDNSLIRFKEEYLAINGKKYIQYYYTAKLKENVYIDLNIDKNNILQYGEIKSINWMDFKTAYKSIRSYHHTKRGILYKVNQILLNRFNAL